MRILAAAALLAIACGGAAHRAGAGAAQPPPISYRVVETWPHDPGAFTQGLLLHDGRLYESTGLHGRSTLREVEMATGRVMRSVSLPVDEFGEGLALAGDRLVQLTWQSGVAHVWDLKSFTRVAEWSYDGEGWGLTFDGRELVQSDGSARLTFRDPRSFASVRTLDVRRAGAPQFYLNELEWIDGAIWANVWQSDEIVRIDPAGGEVTGVLDLAGLLPDAERRGADVLNGIAWDGATRRLLVTGKQWPKLFALELVEPASKG